MKIILQKIYRFFAGPQIGDLYYRDVSYGNPFNESESNVVIVIDRRDQWVQFQNELKNGKPCPKTQWEFNVCEFQACYTFIGTKQD